LASPENLDLHKMNEMVGAFHKESDRGAAILAGSFLEHYLGLFLRSKIVDEKIADKLFDAMGPLASFSQRIAIAYAFGFINKQQHTDLELIRKIRNHFAHHPLNGTFQDNEVKTKVTALSTYGKSDGYKAEHGRQVYVFACGVLCAKFEVTMRATQNASA
jgi:mannitol repressor